MSRSLGAFIRGATGHKPKDLSLFETAMTHSSSSGGETYERLEFLGDRVLGLIVARWLYDRFDAEAEGKLSQRFNVLVSRETCGEIGRGIGLPDIIRVGKQAREDGANYGDNVVGDVVEALIGALYLDGGYEAAERFVRERWEADIESQGLAPKHPKSSLQELAASRGWDGPEYEVVHRSGAHHAPRFTTRVSISGRGEATAEGASKQEAETEAAAALLKQLRAHAAKPAKE